MNKNISKLKKSNIINFEKFSEIIRNDTDLGISLLKLFKQQTYDYLNNLQQALSVIDKDPQKLFEATHAIKGASLCIAAEKITGLAANIEGKIRNNNPVVHNECNELIKTIQELFQDIISIEVDKS